MAKQSGTVFFEGTIDDLTFYKMNGQYYVRKKSRLTGKRVKKDPQFVNSMRNASCFGLSAKMASKVYRLLPKENQLHGVIGDMTAMANRFIRAGLNAEEVIVQLQKQWLPKVVSKEGSGNHINKGALSLTRFNGPFYIKQNHSQSSNNQLPVAVNLTLEITTKSDERGTAEEYIT